jgi:hypothetical protein
MPECWTEIEISTIGVFKFTFPDGQMYVFKAYILTTGFTGSINNNTCFADSGNI